MLTLKEFSDCAGPVTAIELKLMQQLVSKFKTIDSLQQFDSLDFEVQKELFPSLYMHKCKQVFVRDIAERGYTLKKVSGFAKKYHAYCLIKRHPVRKTSALIPMDRFSSFFENEMIPARNLSDAKTLCETLKTPEAIQAFMYLPTHQQNEILPNVHMRGYSGVTFSYMVQTAYRYAEYMQKIRQLGRQPRKVCSSIPQIATGCSIHTR